MTLPASWTQIPVICSYTNRDGDPASGYVTFDSQQQVVIGGVVIVPKTITMRLDGNGQISGTLPSTNDPDLSVTGWTYTVTEHIRDGRAPFTIEVPYTETQIDLATYPIATTNLQAPVQTGIYATDIGVTVASQAAVENAQTTAENAQDTADSAQAAADGLRSDLADSASGKGPDLVQVDGSFTLRQWIANLLTSAGAALVGFVQSGTGASTITLQAKGRQFVHADDWGLVGDGVTDETTKLQQIITAAQGKTLMLGYNKTYALATATGLAFPANTTIISNGSKFKRLTAQVGAVTDANYNITVGDDCEIDRLEVQCVGGGADIGGVIVSGSRVNIGLLKVTSPSSGSGSAGGDWNAVRIGPNSGTATDVFIREVVTENFDRAVIVQNITGGSIGFMSVTTYRRGVYIKDCANFTVRGGKITGLSANATGAAGDNGVLIESFTSHGSAHDIRIENVSVHDSGEHGYRIGGSFLARNIWHVSCHAKNSGAANNGASYPPGNNGGCGFKALGPSSVFGSLHQNIHYVNCSVENVNATSIANVAARAGKSNFAGFQLGKVFGGSIVNPIVLVPQADSGTYAEAGNSCFNGIEIIGCRKVTITNPQIQRPYNSGVYIYDFTDGVNDWGQTDDIDIIGGHVNSPGVAGLEVDCSVITMRRISTKGLQINGGAYAVKVAKSGTGAFSACHADIRTISATTETFNGLGTDWTVSGDINGLVGTSDAKNGSMYQDTFNGTLKVRKGGAWCPITGSATYDPASLADGAGVTTTVTATGAALGDRAQATFSLDLQGITLTAWVSAANTVSVRFQNESGGVLDLGSGTLRVFVEKA